MASAMGRCGSSQQLKQMQIPSPPGWDGHESNVIWEKAVIPFASADCGSDAEEYPQALMDTVQRANVGGAGYRLVAVFMPLKHQNGVLEHLECVNVGVKAMCFFQRVPRAPEEALESCVYSTAFEPFKQGNPESVVYENLKTAKDTMFPVSGIVAEPQKAYPHIGEHIAHVICQRPDGDAPDMSDKKYTVATCKSDLEPDKFAKFLAGFSSSQKILKITSIFRPPNFPAKTDVHFVFESAPRRYHMAHVDLEFCTSTSQVKHDLYTGTIARAAEKGWELAGIFDMLNGTVSPNGKTFTCTIRLVFQAGKVEDQPQPQAPAVTPQAGLAQEPTEDLQQHEGALLKAAAAEAQQEPEGKEDSEELLIEV